MDNKKLNEVLDIDDTMKVLNPVEKTDDEEIDSEYEYTKQNLHHIIDRGSDALEEMLMIAKQTEQPRAFEVVSTLLKTLSDANKDLLELKNKQKTLKGEKNTPKNVTNALFVGSTAELQKMIKEAKK
jgi:hypothetical protein|tara:strand:+ start:22368 stop:22748 length:381 start_codon:yes stop_codon:yes gene_type:complete